MPFLLGLPALSRFKSSRGYLGEKVDKSLESIKPGKKRRREHQCGTGLMGEGRVHVPWCPEHGEIIFSPSSQ